MTITKRTLERWRKEALVYTPFPTGESMETLSKENGALRERILRLTQVLLDQHLMKERKS
ncbi:MAG: hypothetical protein KJ888_20605 [Gammaproteobacteria bacterium]|uniref:Uncharacterized protein n=1 Tax=viral metagenome TaxID=1070528 RepID=A0A6H1ZX04_9ZZZZ|nr:hypothetical protein [Gammaproteobacteria bacterium]